LENLYLITAGHRLHQPAELLNSPRLAEFVSAVKHEFSFILFDTSPILPVTDALVIASKMDAIVLIHQIGKIARAILYRAKNQLEGTKAKILGIVLNNLKPSEMEAGLPYYYYGRKYHYGEKS
jgi:capsular exopolysaccharide synthesis family protein